MMKMLPKISYINSAYNSVQFLTGLMDDLLHKQSLKDIEVIVVNSASTDATLEVAKDWQKVDSRVVIVDQPKRTYYGESWLDGWKIANGDIVANSNSDDRSMPWRGHAVYDSWYNNFVSRINTTNGFFYGGYETRVDGVTTAVGIPQQFSVDDFSQFFRAGVHIHWTNNIRLMTDWDKMYDAARKYKSAFDYWLTLYFMKLGFTGCVIPKVLSIYNQRKDSLEQSDKSRSGFESLCAIEEFFPNSPAIKNLYSNPNKNFVEQYVEFKKCLT